MTDISPPGGIDYQDHLLRALAELKVPTAAADAPIETNTLATAGRIVAQRQNKTHRIMHADAQRGGAVIWGLRERGHTWREIYDLTGIVQRTGHRWMDLFLAEGVTERPNHELDQRWQGAPDASGDSGN